MEDPRPLGSEAKSLEKAPDKRIKSDGLKVAAYPTRYRQTELSAMLDYNTSMTETLRTRAFEFAKAPIGCGCLFMLCNGLVVGVGFLVFVSIFFLEEFVDQRIVAFLPLVVAPIVFFFSAVALSRYMMRFIPVPVSLKARFWWLPLLILSGITFIPRGVDEFAYSFFSFRYILVVPMALILVALRSTFYDRHRLQHNKYLLFLRSFDSFADFSTVSAIIRAAPRGVPVVMLVRPGARSATWDPLVLGFTRLFSILSLRESPIFMRARHDEWEQAVQKLAYSSLCIVLDITDPTESIRKEFDIVSDGFQHKTLFVQNANNAPESKESLIPELQIPNDSALVAYEKNLSAGLDRLTFAGILGAMVVYGAMLEDQNRNIPIILEQKGLFYLLGCITGVAIFLCPIIAPFLFRPMPNASSVRKIRETIRSIVNQSMGTSMLQ